ncbi:Tim44 domain-containing protein [Sphingomonas gilva]|uniref:Tim44 domain-containing protein n=1 Tax=Sphingomonas gilva TaxID=2305907 RepID=A0A396RJG9_9SPHN|nr:Tim44 domain-containing protein [Sphingomonas gilva]
MLHVEFLIGGRVVYVVLLALVAGFLALRLYAVLGKRTGHEQPLPRTAEEGQIAGPAQRPAIDIPSERRDTANPVVDPTAEAGVRAIAQAEPGFSPEQFVDGAKAAYKMILEAFWRGDEEELSWLVDEDVRSAFAAAIAQRAEAGHTLDNKLVGIERAIISAASVDGRNARITVRIDADIAAVTRDGEGNVIAGSMSDAVETHDVWTFARTLKGDDPNWKLVETDED